MEQTPVANKNGIIALVGIDATNTQLISSCNFVDATIMSFPSGVDLTHRWERGKLPIVAIISQSEVIGSLGVSLLETLKKNKFPNVPFFIISEKLNENLNKICMQSGIADVFKIPIRKEQIESRVNFLIKNWSQMQKKVAIVTDELTTYKIPLPKRIFDVFFSGLALICLAPIFLLIIIIMKLESKGPVFYYAKRVGTGYHIFKFYKFRSMYVNADKRLKELQHLNQYSGASASEEPAQIFTSDSLCDHCIKNGTKCQQVLYADGNTWCEKNYINSRKSSAGSAFFKIKNDPRVTKVGKFLRNTSIDELPQLWNVFIGDMSIVGNRPLPLYEAEKLTTDKYALRFRAPAGITGLWQVEKRGKGEMSEEERLMLDNSYAENHSFLKDILLILKTVPALFQKESV